MTIEKKLYICEQYANKLSVISMGLMQEAARAGNFGRGYAVVAREVSVMSERLASHTAAVKFDGADLFDGIINLALQMSCLATNCMIEIIRTCETDNTMSNNKAITVFADQLLKVAHGLNELEGGKLWQRPYTLPEAAAPITSSSKSASFIKLSAGGVEFAENVLNVREVFYLGKESLKSGEVEIRGMKLPLVDLFAKFNLAPLDDGENRPIAVINPDYSGRTTDKCFAIAVDAPDINAIFYSKIGRAVELDGGSKFSGYARECWDAVGGGQMVFMDWDMVLGK